MGSSLFVVRSARERKRMQWRCLWQWRSRFLEKEKILMNGRERASASAQLLSEALLRRLVVVARQSSGVVTT